jgi:hypothetical protein
MWLALSVPETVDYFSVAAKVRSIRSTLRSSARSSPARLQLLKQHKLLSGVPCMERLSNGLLRLRLPPLPQHRTSDFNLLGVFLQSPHFMD